MKSSKNYRGSNKRLVLCLTLTSMVCYTLTGSFPDENKILALALLPFCIMQMMDYIKESE